MRCATLCTSDAFARVSCALPGMTSLQATLIHHGAHQALQPSWKSLGPVSQPRRPSFIAFSTRSGHAGRTSVAATAEAQAVESSPTTLLAPLLLLGGLGLAAIGTGANPVRVYNSLLEAHPFATKLATGVTGAFLGDLLAQAFPPLMARLNARRSGQPLSQGAHPFTYDVARAGRFMAFSAFWATPVVTVWFQFLDATIMPHDPTAVAAVATKVALDQLLMAPVMTSCFFLAMAAMQGQIHMGADIIRAKLLPTMKANYLLWPLAHCVNFGFIASEQRILYVNCVAVLWSVILSTMAAAPTTAAAQAPRDAAATAAGAAGAAAGAAAPRMGRKRDQS